MKSIICFLNIIGMAKPTLWHNLSDFPVKLMQSKLIVTYSLFLKVELQVHDCNTENWK